MTILHSDIMVAGPAVSLRNDYVFMFFSRWATSWISITKLFYYVNKTFNSPTSSYLSSTVRTWTAHAVCESCTVLMALELCLAGHRKMTASPMGPTVFVHNSARITCVVWCFSRYSISTTVVSTIIISCRGDRLFRCWIWHCLWNLLQKLEHLQLYWVRPYGVGLMLVRWWREYWTDVRFNHWWCHGHVVHCRTEDWHKFCVTTFVVGSHLLSEMVRVMIPRLLHGWAADRF